MPSVECIERVERLREVIAPWTEAMPTMFGVWHQVDPRIPRHRVDDYRIGDFDLLAVATSTLSFVLRSPTPAMLELLAKAWQGPAPPYLVFADAHDALHRWSRLAAVPFEPRRLGCLRIASALLSEGRTPYRDLPRFDGLVERVLGRPAPQTALGAEADSPAAAAQRAATVLEVMEALTPRLRRRALVPVHHLECQVLPAVIAMERAGLGVDAAAFQRIADAWLGERRITQEPERVARLEKLLSTYAYWPREFIRDGRIHPLLHPLATDSGRFACTDPNLQQVPSEHTAPGLRACFTPGSERGLVIADYAQIELRVAAHVARCPDLRRVFVEGRDPHRTTAATITGKSESEVTPHERQLAKAVNFGFLFGMGPRRFRDYAATSYGVHVSDVEARHAKDAFFGTYRGVARWHRKVAQLGQTPSSVVVRTVLGRRKRFPAGRFSFNAALNIPVQGTAAEGFKRAMILLHERLPPLGGCGVLCVHDEYLAEAPRDRLEDVEACVREAMRDAMATMVPSVPIVVTAHRALSWADKGA